MKKIIIKFIEQKDQRMGLTADWWFDEEDNLQIRVTDLGDWRYNFLVARHEMDEAAKCKADGITTKVVDDYCLIARARKINLDPDSFEGYPGAPHQSAHNDALAAEWIMSRLLRVKWPEYSKRFQEVEAAAKS